jgi:hypothetical protein
MQPEQTHNVDQHALAAFLRDDLVRGKEGTRSRFYLHAIVDMGRLPDNLRAEVVKKLEAFKLTFLLTHPDYVHFKWYGAVLVSAQKGNSDTLLEEWGTSNSDIISAWIVSGLDSRLLAAHLRGATFAFDADKVRYLLRYYDPLVTQLLHRLADEKWVRGFFSPIVAWWYPVDTPQKETWRKIEGEGRSFFTSHKPLVLSEELWEALESDPFPYRLLNFVEDNYPSAFGSDCYGVRLAKIDDLVEAGKKQGLSTRDDLTVYVVGLLEKPARAEEPRWQASLQAAATGHAPLKTYFSARVGSNNPGGMDRNG